MLDSLKDKTIKGVGWSAAENISNTGIKFLVGILLARRLTPDDYGLIVLMLSLWLFPMLLLIGV